MTPYLNRPLRSHEEVMRDRHMNRLEALEQQHNDAMLRCENTTRDANGSEYHRGICESLRWAQDQLQAKEMGK